MSKKKVRLVISSTLIGEKLDLIFGKKVEQVTECRRKNLAGLPYIGWKGTTENEYFVVTFVAGVLMMIIDEREMRLTYTDNLLSLGFSAEAFDRFQNPGVNNERLLEYNLDIYYKELNSLTFDDVMELINWEWKGKKHIEEDILS